MWCESLGVGSSTVHHNSTQNAHHQISLPSLIPKLSLGEKRRRRREGGREGREKKKGGNAARLHQRNCNIGTLLPETRRYGATEQERKKKERRTAAARVSEVG